MSNEALSISEELYNQLKDQYNSLEVKHEMRHPDEAKHNIYYIAAEEVEKILNIRNNQDDDSLEKFQDYMNVLSSGRNPFNNNEIRAANISLDRWQLILDKMKEAYGS